MPGVIGSAADLDFWLVGKIRYLRKKYQIIGDPFLLYLAASSFEPQVRVLPASARSYQYSKLLGFMGEVLLAHGRDAETLRIALKHIDEAEEVLSRVDAVSEEVMEQWASLGLHRAVINKALGDYREASLAIDQTRSLLRNKLRADGELFIMLDRQDVIMRQDAAWYAKMAEDASAYAVALPMEYYGTIKRMLEFVMNKKMLKDVEYILPEFRRAFVSVRNRLPILSHVSYAKNAGQACAILGDSNTALRVLGKALQQADGRGLVGQVRQIKELMEASRQGRDAVLSTFRV